MCEIAVFDPDASSLHQIHDVAATFYEEQGDGLGVLAIKDRGDHFEYETYKSTDPHWQTLFAFLRRNVEDTYRYVVHGRYATSGNVNRDTAHPIEVDCECNEFEYVVHNGSVRNHSNKRHRLRDDGCTFNTVVDSELIPHYVEELPEDITELKYNSFRFRGNLNYLLFSENGIFVRTTSKYHLADDFTMTCQPDELEGFEEGNDTKYMKVLPGGEIETADRTRTSTRTYYSGAGTTSGGSGNRSTTTATTGAAHSSHDGVTSRGSKISIDYDDLVPQMDGVAAVKVAPGVIRIINLESDANISHYINKDEEPKQYYYFATEEPPEGMTFEEEGGNEATARVVDNGRSFNDDFEEIPNHMVGAGNQAFVEAIAAEEGVSMAEAADIADDVAEILD